MATIALDVKINALNSAETLGELKNGIKDLNRELEKLPEGSDEFRKVASAVGNAKDKLADMNEELVQTTTKAGKFQAVTGMASQLAAGFGAAESAMALFGSESEVVAKALQKVQAAMGLIQSIKELEGFGDAWKNFKTVALDALKGVRAGIAATGIGLLVIALGTIVAYWDDIKEAVSGVSEEQKKLLEDEKKSVQAAQNKLDSISKSENILKLQGKTEKEILLLKKQATAEEIKALEAQLLTQESMRSSQIETAKRNRDILEGILKFITAPITFLLKSIDKVGEVLGKDFGLEEGLYKSVAELVFDPEATAEEADKTIEETRKKLDELKNSQAGYQLQINKINEDAALKRKEQREKADKEEEERKKQKKIDDENAIKGEEAMLQQIIDADNEEAARKEKLRQAEIEAEAAKNAAIIQASLDRYEEEKKLEAEKLARQERNKEFTINSTLETLTVIQELTSAFAGKSEAAQRKAFNINKSAQIAEATISTILAAQKAFTSQVIPGDPTSPIRGAIAAALAVAAGVARVKKIASTQFEGGGGAGGGMASAGAEAGGAMSAPLQGGVNNTSTQLANLAQGTQEQKPIKAYVLQTDVASEDQKMKAIENKSKIE